MSKLKIIDLFSGIGGLSLGFKNSGYSISAHLDIEKNCIDTLKLNFNDKGLFIHEDITNIDSYISKLKNHNDGNIDGIIGGPPCQAYSLAGRINKKNKMDEDPRNFLFESFVKVLEILQPKFFIFENVVGMLSAKPFGVNILDDISKSFESANFEINNDFRSCVFDMSEYSIPQKRKRVIIFGVNKNYYNNSRDLVKNFYVSMNKKTSINQQSVRDAIYDLPKILPVKDKDSIDTKNPYMVTEKFEEHLPRFHNQRDIKIFKILTEDIQNGTFKYTSSNELKKLYKKFTNKDSKVHKYHVLRWDKPSNTIPAHLYKDGLRHIHPDPEQCRSITVREAARLMTFPDNFKFSGSRGEKYKGLGNAVPPKFAEVIAKTIKEVL